MLKEIIDYYNTKEKLRIDKLIILSIVAFVILVILSFLHLYFLS